MVEFVKMHGLGNDFVIIDARRLALVLTPEQTKLIADRRYGVGCDQLIVLNVSERADAKMRIYNPDSSEVQACGNATRCIGQLLLEQSGQPVAHIETLAGVLRAERRADGISVDMGPARLDASSIPLSQHDVDTRCVSLDMSAIDPTLPGTFSAINMGNPHAIFFVDDIGAYRLDKSGAMLERHPIFPERANISLVQVLSRTHLAQRVWERGAGLTLACGSGACAAAVAAHRAGLAERKVRVTLPGGSLQIEWREDGHVIMSGGVAKTFSGHFAPEFLSQ